jgi:hypothetical protein
MEVDQLDAAQLVGTLYECIDQEARRGHAPVDEDPLT